MRDTQISDLERVTEAAFQKEYRSLRPLLEAEAMVRAQLARLDAQLHQVREDCASATAYRTTGTDILWNGWESAARRQLNIELAGLRARKLAALETLRQAFGRQQAVGTLSQTLRASAKREAAKRHLAG